MFQDWSQSSIQCTDFENNQTQALSNRFKACQNHVGYFLKKIGQVIYF